MKIKLLILAVVAMAFMGCEPKYKAGHDNNKIPSKKITLEIGDSFLIEYGYEINKFVIYDYNENGIFATIKTGRYKGLEDFFSFSELESKESFKLIKKNEEERYITIGSSGYSGYKTIENED